MNTINITVSIGELLDKITILEIKSTHTDNEYVHKELKELNEVKNTLKSFTMEYMNDLREINRKLWNIEDQIRQKEKRGEFDDEFISLARSVYLTNDMRAEVKKKINSECESLYVEIKLYSK